MTKDAHSEPTLRVTSPMQDYGTREVTIGLVIALVGLFITFVVPLLL